LQAYSGVVNSPGFRSDFGSSQQYIDFGKGREGYSGVRADDQTGLPPFNGDFFRLAFDRFDIDLDSGASGCCALRRLEGY
jgi:hypothetical protein